jgi:glutathione S-transferase
MPRPDLMPMTGGYRRTPVMQIGADIYCDTQCIMRELERRFPEPDLLPTGYEGLAWGSAMWTDRPFFQNTVNLVFGTLADKVPASFIADREKLRGAKFDVAAMKAAIPQMRDQFRAHLAWIDVQLGDERTWLAGESPSLVDINVYMNVWYARSRSDAANRRAARSQRSERPQGRRQGRGRARRLRQDPRGRRDRRAFAPAHRHPPARSAGRRGRRAFPTRRISYICGLIGRSLKGTF